MAPELVMHLALSMTHQSEDLVDLSRFLSSPPEVFALLQWIALIAIRQDDLAWYWPNRLSSSPSHL